MELSDAFKNTDGERQEFVLRVVIVGFGVVVLLGILVGRMFYLQFTLNEELTRIGNTMTTRDDYEPGIRGLIFDRHGAVLAENVPAFRLEITPRDAGDIDQTIDALSRLVQIGDHDRNRFQGRLKREKDFSSIPLRLRLSPEEHARLTASPNKLPGVSVRAGLTRHYALGASTAHAVGYVGAITARDLEKISGDKTYLGATHIGKTGIERQYEALLHGTPAKRTVIVNAHGRIVGEEAYQRGTPGKDLVLTLDARLQRTAEAQMAGRRGAAILMDIATGDLLAFVATPNFDPNLFVDGISHRDYNALTGNEYRPLFNRALKGRYPPGSTVKPLVALAGLEYRDTRPRDRINCPGFYKLPDKERRHRDWKRDGHGPMHMHDAVAESCDVYFYDLAYRMGIDRIHEFLGRFNLGLKTGIDLPGEGSGILPSQEWKMADRGEAWFPGETLNIGIGQGFMVVTPLQLVQFTALLGGRGQAHRPRLLRATIDPVSNEIERLAPQPAPPVTVRDRRHWQLIHDSMVAVVHAENGTARQVGLGAGYRIAGKTGTAQVAGLSQEDDTAPQLEDVPENLRDHSLFVAYAPADAPRLAIAVIVEHSGGGSAVAAPIARQILDAAFAGDDSGAANAS